MSRSWPLLAIAAIVSGCSASTSDTDTKNRAAAADAVSAVLGQLNPDDRKAFSGGNGIGRQIATIRLPSTPEEAAYLASPSEGPRFLDYAFKTYPEITRIAFKPDDDIKSDPDSYATYRQGFYAALYFAERIRLADGGTLFDLVTKCSSSVDPLTSAEIDVLAKPAPGFALQFFPALRTSGGKVADQQILLDRQGDTVTARSPLFSTSVLTSKTFMRDHGVECAA